MTVKTRSQLATEFTALRSELTIGHHNNVSKANAYKNLLDSVVVPGEETINIDGYRCTDIVTDDYFDTTEINGVITISVSDKVITADSAYNSVSAVSLSTNSSTPVLVVTVSGLGISKTYSSVIGARLAINTTGTPANCGYIDIVAMGSVVTDGSAVATFTFDAANVSIDYSKLKPAISSVSSAIAASTGGFTISATRVTGVLMSVSSTQAWIVTIDEVV